MAIIDVSQILIEDFLTCTKGITFLFLARKDIEKKEGSSSLPIIQVASSNKFQEEKVFLKIETISTSFLVYKSSKVIFSSSTASFTISDTYLETYLERLLHNSLA